MIFLKYIYFYVFIAVLFILVHQLLSSNIYILFYCSFISKTIFICSFSFREQ